MNAPRAAWYSHELCHWHDPGAGSGYLPVGPGIEPLRQFAVDPDLRRAEGLVRASGVMDHFTAVTPLPATDEELLRVHVPEHLERVEAASAAGAGDAGVYAHVNYHSAHAARLAAGACAQAATAVVEGRFDRAYCLVRPPGHHAEPDRAMALCLYNNLAVAARAAQRHGVRRVLVLDWDVHHGNGLQRVFYDDPDVLYVSLHQDGLFPAASGRVLETGTGKGTGRTLNVPLPAGSGHGAYLAALDQVVEPAARAFRPELILVAAGVDAGAHDPMGRMMCTSRTFHALSSALCRLADELAGGRIVFAHEGGYSAWYQPTLVLATAAAIAGLPAPHDPFLHALEHLPGQRLQPHQSRVLTHLRDHHPLLTGQGTPVGAAPGGADG
ncbi:class II histone deacetylase [Streptomyces sp. SID4934]|uniref:class II histone deacetylase n=1 Tax=unclassified Streptomyces TaxID=2593676 RepID=UPI00081E8579|nr:class II histone deacetylase [Streptomyces sp. ScaeMP-6W]MYQ71721.1 class II histone deacetylase [Streptomyces sp. SID4934]SCD83353.1 Acetoin utilization deacetylase AcuC [Streptomyces sp. ScaeMP-6W]